MGHVYKLKPDTLTETHTPSTKTEEIERRHGRQSEPTEGNKFTVTFTWSSDGPVSQVGKLLVCSCTLSQNVETTWTLQRRRVVFYCTEPLNNTLIAL